MKSYLSLIPISAKVHRRKSRMTRLCIVLAVFLVTAIFSMADMEIRSQKIRAIDEYGNWHIQIKNPTREAAGMIALRPDVEASSWYNTLNYRLKEDYLVSAGQEGSVDGQTSSDDEEMPPAAYGKKTCICGMEEVFLSKIMADGPVEGTFPKKEGEALLLDNAKESLGVEVGDTVRLTTPSGDERTYRITGFAETEAMVTKSDAVILCLPVEFFLELYGQEKQVGVTEADMAYVVRFKDHIHLRRAIDDVKGQFGLRAEDVGENMMLTGLSGAGGDTTMLALYGAAVVLFLLVLAAGTLMIASSMNSNVCERTSFFGMLRCIGADRKQTMRFVRLEALCFCRSAIPLGVSAGIFMTWVMCALLRFLSAEFFEDLPVFGVSIAGILMGAVTGVLTVLIAASSPAKKAAKVSPLTAVSGNAWRGEAEGRGGSRRRKKTRAGGGRLLDRVIATGRIKIDTALGIHHAFRNKGNFLLMTGSFAISIILFLSFSSLWDFMGYAITPLRPYTPDFSIVSRDETCSVPREFVSELYRMEGVKRVFGRQFAYDIGARSASGRENVMLLSYEALQFNWADEEDWASDKIGLEKVAKDTGEGLVLAAWSEDSPWRQGDRVKTDLGELTIAGFLEHCPFGSMQGTDVFVCSEALFAKLTGQTDYTIIDIQVKGQAGERLAEALRELAGEEFLFSDNRLSNSSAKGAYYSFAVFVYGFLGIIAVIAAFNIINSISMSVSAKYKQYGAMRAVGMDMGQVGRMIRAETCTYALAGVAAGTLLGLPIHRLLWNKMILPRWNAPWEVPAAELVMIVALVAVSCALAVRGPVKRIERMDVVDVIAEY